MTPPPEPFGGHYNPVFVTVLPKERRALHPYQLWIMIALIVMPISQLLLGLPDTSTIKAIPRSQAYIVNIVCLICGLTGVYAAFIPERIMKLDLRARFRVPQWLRWVIPPITVEFDATWSRLFIELAGQVFLVFIWATYVVTIFSVYPLWTREGFITGGLTLGGGLACFLGIAAAHRSGQIAWTLHRAFLGRGESAIVGIDTVKDETRKQAQGG